MANKRNQNNKTKQAKFQENKKDYVKKNYQNKPRNGASEADSSANRKGAADANERGGMDFNDISWYANSDQSLRDAASFSFNNPLGIDLDFDNSFNPSGGKLGAIEDPIPGVMAIDVYPAFGEVRDANSALNVAINNIYSFVRHANSGSKNYFSADLAMYLAGGVSLYSFHEWMKRVYGCVNAYTQKNRYYPETIFKAMNVDFNDIQTHISDFRTYINQCAVKLAAFYLPNTMPIFKRQMFIYSGIYTDSVLSKAQTYVFNPMCFLKYNPTRLETGGCLVEVPMRPRTEVGQILEPLTFEDIRDKFDSMFNAMWLDEDCGIISGDIKKAYGDNLVRPTMISEDYRTVPSYNEEVLSSIHNLRILGSVNDEVENSDVVLRQVNDYQLTDRYSQKAALSAPAGAVWMNHPINIHKEDVKPEDVMIATRLLGFGVDFENSGSVQTFSAYGYASEIVAHIGVFSTTPLADGNYEIFSTYSNFLQINTISLNNVAYITQFAWAPLFYTYQDGTNPGILDINVLRVVGDIANYHLLSPDKLRNINLTATLTMFGVPQEYTVH